MRRPKTTFAQEEGTPKNIRCVVIVRNTQTEDPTDLFTSLALFQENFNVK